LINQWTTRTNITILCCMKLKVQIAGILLIVIGMANLAGADSVYKPDAYQDLQIQNSLSYVYADSFSQAYQCLDSIIEKTPQFWPAVVIKAGIIYMEMTDDESYGRQQYFLSLIDSSTKALENHLDTLPNDPWALFFAGTAYSYQAVWEGQHGSMFKTLSLGLKVGKYFGQASKVDTSFHDAYLGLGFFHYLRSAKLGILRSLPFVADQREQGIIELKKARSFGKYSKVTAALSLGWIYFDRKEYEKADSLVDSLIASGMTGRQIQWLKASICHSISDADGMIAAFSSIQDGLIKKGHQNNYNLVTCGYYLGLAYYINGEKQAALANFDKALAYNLSPFVEKRLSDKLKSARNYREKLIIELK
jgi:tetratricopeptide (TPR) repeat protein